MSKDCKHDILRAKTQVVINEDNTRFLAQLKINCETCGTQFSFIGLPLGLTFHGATVDVDGTEARLAIAPREEVLTELEGTPHGITERRK